jgi:hypothetical protein
MDLHGLKQLLPQRQVFSVGHVSGVADGAFSA